LSSLLTLTDAVERRNCQFLQGAPKVRLNRGGLASDKTDSSLPLVGGLACRHSDDWRALNCLPCARMQIETLRSEQPIGRDKMRDKNYRTVVGRLVWQMGMALALALSLLAALALVRKVYMVQEALIVMLLTALSVAVILLLLVGFVLFQAGIRRAILLMTTGAARLAKFSHRHVGATGPIIPPPFQR
jgi:hypothetical protein